MQNATPPPAENTRYGYKTAEGHRLHVSTVGAARDHVELAIAGIGDLDWRSLNIPATEVPGIALALLRTAGFVPSGDSEPSGFRGCVETAAGHLDDAVLIADGLAAAAELTRRRDELAQNLVGDGAFAYGFADPELQRAIDMIIQLQDEATK